jgi:inhibitor of KinA sporulation pathway (predicted exonuclease)
MRKNEKKVVGKLVNVIDLEACCWYGNPPSGQYKEIIEIGITTVDFYTKDVIESRSIIVKPEFSEISDFCTKLTTLTPGFVKENGVTFKKACKILMEEFNSEKRMWFSWGDYDRTAFEKECSLKNIKYPLSKTHFNLKELYSFKFGFKQSQSVTTALKNLGIEFDGTQHRGVDDSRNTAYILQKMF